MARLALVVGLAAVAVLVAMLVRNRADVRPTPLPAPQGWRVPRRLERADFPRPEAPWLVAVFTSSTCGSCAGTLDKARPLDCDEVAVVEVESTADRALHERYGIEAVPAIVVADRDGDVLRWFLGPPPTSELWAAMAALRDGTAP